MVNFEMSQPIEERMMTYPYDVSESRDHLTILATATFGRQFKTE